MRFLFLLIKQSSVEVPSMDKISVSPKKRTNKYGTRMFQNIFEWTRIHHWIFRWRKDKLRNWETNDDVLLDYTETAKMFSKDMQHVSVSFLKYKHIKLFRLIHNEQSPPGIAVANLKSAIHLIPKLSRITIYQLHTSEIMAKTLFQHDLLRQFWLKLNSLLTSQKQISII